MVKRDFAKLAGLTLEYGEQYGLDHSLRLISLVKQLAAGRAYNEDVIVFSAYVHDFGGYSRFASRAKTMRQDPWKYCPNSSPYLITVKWKSR